MNIKIAKKIVFGCMLVGMTCFLNAEETIIKGFTFKDFELEKSFLNIVAKASIDVDSTRNGIKKEKIMSDSYQSLCKLFKGKEIHWLGEVRRIGRTVGETSDVEISLGQMYIITPFEKQRKWFDTQAHSHIPVLVGSLHSNTQPYNALSEIEEGEPIKFTGRFKTSPTSNECIKTYGKNQYDSLEFVFDFTRVQKLETSEQLKLVKLKEQYNGN